MTGQDPFDRIRTYLDIAQAAFEEIVDTYTPKHATEGFDEVRDLLDRLGVDKPAATYSDVEKGEIRDVLDTLGVDKPTPEAAPDPDGVLWEVALRDDLGGTIEFRADTIEYGVEDDCGITAFVNDKLTFYAPPGTYLFARKVVE